MIAPPPPLTLLKLTHIGYRQNNRDILKNITLSVRQGEITTLIGPNGAGKSTLLRLALGLQRPTSGSVWRRPRLKIGYMPQKLSLDQTLPLTVERFLKLTPDVSPHFLSRICEELKITSLRHKSVHILSGGEMQRVLLARALLREPDLLILDEPIQGVDLQGQQNLYALIREARDHRGCGILQVSHDLHRVMAASDKVICLNGHICCMGRPIDVQEDPAYQALVAPLPEDQSLSKEIGIYEHHHDHCHDVPPDEDLCSHPHHQTPPFK